MNAKRLTILFFLIVAMTAWQPAIQAQARDTAEALQTRIEALRSDSVAWRKIQWKTCLLEGLKTSREQKKPLMLWIFIDRPIDDARC